jgi:hypothetical protein
VEALWASFTRKRARFSVEAYDAFYSGSGLQIAGDAAFYERASSAQPLWSSSRGGVPRFRRVSAGLWRGIDPGRARCATRISVDEYRKLKRRSREVIRVEDLRDEDVAQIAEGRMDPRHDHLDTELK